MHAWAPRLAPLIAALVASCALHAGGLGPSDEGAIDGGEVAAIDAAFPDAHVLPLLDASIDDAPSIDASDAADAGRVGDAADDASDAAVDPCDKDRDGHRDIGGLCLGDDCCDTDPNAHPGQTSYFGTPSACGSFDFDCDGTSTIETGTVSCKLGFFTCSGDGFAGATACGVTAKYQTCSWAGFSCNTNDGMRTQRCR